MLPTMDLHTTIGSHCRRVACKVTPEATLRRAAELMRERHVGSVIVVDADRPVGMLTDRDITVRVYQDGREPGTTKVGEVMSQPVHTVPFDATVAEAIRMMRRHRIRRLPLTSHDGSLYGLVAMDDLVITLGRQLAELGQVIKREQANETAGEEDAS